MRSIRDVDRGAVPATEDADSVRVIAMIVRDHDGADRAWRQPDLANPPLHLSAAETRVDEDPRPTRLDEGGVTRATGPENANLHRGFSSRESLMRVGSLAFRACPLPRPP